MHRMKLVARTLALAALLLCGSAAGAAEPPPAKAGPRIVVEKETVDAGQVVRGSAATFTFVVRNTGTEVLKILSAKPG